MPTYNNKVVLRNGTVVLDVTPTTAVEEDVAEGKKFIKADGSLGTGTASGGGSVIVTETPDSHGGTIIDIDAEVVKLQSKTVSPSTTSQTVTPDTAQGYTGLSSVTVNAMPTGTAGTPTATKGTVQQHSVEITPSVTNTAGYISGGTKTGNPVTVTASELVSGSTTLSSNNTYDVTNYASVVVSVSGSSKNVQVAAGVNRVNTTSYTAITGQSITVSTTGTYDVYWTGYRSSTGGTNGTQLYIDNTAYGTAQTTFSNNGQSVHLTGVSLTKNQVITLRARARSTSYYMYGGNLTIVQTA